MRVLALAVVAFITFTWVLIPIRTHGDSMVPTYRSDSFNLVNRLSYAFGEPARGDVVAIRLAGPRLVLVKRVIGLPGERVRFESGVVRINDAPLIETYVHYRRSWDLPEVTLGPHEYFAVGDNRGMPVALHSFGAVDRVRILGKVVF